MNTSNNSTTLLVNKENLDEVRNIIHQTRKASEQQHRTTYSSIAANGYWFWEAIKINKESNKTVDGATRLTAVCNLIERGVYDELAVTCFHLTAEESLLAERSANAGTRGTTIDDLYELIPFVDQNNKLLSKTGHEKAIQECKRAIEMVLNMQGKDPEKEAPIYASIQSNIPTYINYVRKAFELMAEAGEGKALPQHNYSHIIAGLKVGVPISLVRMAPVFLQLGTSTAEARLELTQQFVEAYNA